MKPNLRPPTLLPLNKWSRQAARKRKGEKGKGAGNSNAKGGNGGKEIPSPLFPSLLPNVILEPGFDQMSPSPRGRLRDPPYFRRQCVCVAGKEAVRLSLPDFPFGAKIAKRCQVCVVSGVFLLPRSSVGSSVGLLPREKFQPYQLLSPSLHQSNCLSIPEEGRRELFPLSTPLFSFLPPPPLRGKT